MFDDKWNDACGPTRCSGYPATMNGCGTHRFLVRWRSLAGEAQATAGAFLDSRDQPPTLTAPAAGAAKQGWMDLTGCDTPLWQFAPPPGAEANLSDVAATIQEWQTAP